MDFQKALQQYLSDWQRAGLQQTAVNPQLLDALLSVEQAKPRAKPTTAVPVARQSAPVPASAPVQKIPPKPSPDTVREKRPAVDVRADANSEQVREQRPSATPAAPATTTPAPSPPEYTAPALPIASQSPIELAANATRTDRQNALTELAAHVAACTRCSELADTRKQTVFGVGNPEAEIMFIGEAPGADEDRQGIPFVGKAGQLLDKIITACQLQRDDIYICNILRCRPPGNRNPSPKEAGNCREYLDGQIRIIDPDYIVCWGSVAAQNLLDIKTSIGRLRGKFSTYGRAKVLCTYHPSYLLRNESAKKQVWEDMKFLMADRGVQL